MGNDEKDGRRMTEQLRQRSDESGEAENHVVFDFTGLEKPSVGDLALILTARLRSGPGDNVWVRSLPWRTARILEVLRLDHMFRRYPDSEGELN